MAKVTLSDLSKVFKDDKKPSDFHYYGQIVSVDAENRTYEVSINRDENITVEAARLVGAGVGDTVMVTVMANGYATVTGRVGGDMDASDAQRTADAASTAASNALSQANSAVGTATQAQTRAGEALNIANDAVELAEQAEEEAGRASTAATQAATSAQNAESSAARAATSASNAEGSASSAATAAANAETDASNAADSASRAATSAANAESDASDAAASASNAATSASNAEGSASRAATSASNAESSASSASTSASSAASSASSAATSASNAASDAATARQQSSAATTAANEAKTQAQAAETAANEAKADASSAKRDAAAANTAANGAVAGLAVVQGVVDQLETDVDDMQTHVAMMNAIDEGDVHIPAGLHVVPSASGYFMVIANDGVYVYDNESVLVAKYGHNIVYDSNREHKIGNNTSYIRYYDSNNDGVADAIEIVADNIRLGSYSVGDKITATETTLNNYMSSNNTRVGNVETSVTTTTTNLTNYITSNNQAIENLQGQIDGSIQTWFYEVVPTNNNPPANSWTTTDLKNNHLGDLYYDTITGYCYRYQVQNNVYGWQRITDVDVTKALADAAKAQDTADHKRRVFVTTPTTPYDVGDLWVQGQNGDIFRCATPKTSQQSYDAADWVKASKYTDDTKANSVETDLHTNYYVKSDFSVEPDKIASTISATETTVKTYADGKANAAETNAKTYADGKASTAESNAKTYADNNFDPVGSAASALDDAKDYADDNFDSKGSASEAQAAAISAAAADATSKANAAEANAKADTANKLTSYYTKTQTDSAITQSANSILSTVSTTYQTKDDMDDYSTTAEMNSAINQKADAITSTVSQTYATKTQAQGYADTAESNAISAAATDATNKANAAQSAAATDATTKANNAKDAAIADAATKYYTKTQTYTKSEIEQKAGEISLSVAQEETAKVISVKEASGSIVHIDDAIEYPALSLTATIVPKQSGSGTPSPENIRPISGWESVETSVCGKNLFDISGWISSFAEGQQVTFENDTMTVGLTAGNLYTKPFRFSKTNITITLSFASADAGTSIAPRFELLNENGSAVGSLTLSASGGTITRDAVAVRMNWSSNYGFSVTKPQIELGTTATDYEPCTATTHTTDLGRTVYGGTVDVVRGTLVDNMAIVDLGDLNWVAGFGGFYTETLKNVIATPIQSTKSNLVCEIFSVGNTPQADNIYVQPSSTAYSGWVIALPSATYSTAADFKTAVSGQMLCYELATPQTYQLTPSTINTLAGVNNVWADSGDVYLKYATMNADMQALMNKSNDDLSRAKAEIKVTTDAIESTVISKTNEAKEAAIADAASKYYGKSEVYTKTETVSEIEQRAEEISISVTKEIKDETIYYYLASNKSSGVKITDPGWTRTPQTTTDDKPYLWVYAIVATGSKTEPPEPTLISGSIVSFESEAADLPLNKLEIKIDPQQDLHGYDKPWAPGAGVNKYEPQEGSHIGVTFTAKNDGTVLITGTAIVTSWCFLSRYVDLPYNGISAGDNISVYSDAYLIVQCIDANNTVIRTIDSTNSRVSYDSVPANTVKLRLLQYPEAQTTEQGTTFNMVAHYYIGIDASGTFSTWTPYSNICQISGWNEVSLNRSPYTQTEKHAITGKNLYNAPSNEHNVLVPMHISAGATITISGKTNESGGSPGFRYYNANKEQIDYWTSLTIDAGNGRKYRTVTVLANKGDVEYFEFYGFSDGMDDFMVELGSTCSPYEPYGETYLLYDGINVWDEEWELGYWDASNGNPVNVTSEIRSKNFIPVKPGTQYYGAGFPQTASVIYYDSSKHYLGWGRPKGVFNTPANTAYVNIDMGGSYGTTYNHDISINYPSTEHDYHPYTAGTIYGGTIDVLTGVMTVDKEYRLLDGTGTDSFGITVLSDYSQASWTGASIVKPGANVISDRFEYGGYNGGLGVVYVSSTASRLFFGLPTSVTNNEQAKAWFADNPTQVVFDLATPTTYTLTPQQINTFLGQNNIWANAGDTTVEYWSRAIPSALYLSGTDDSTDGEKIVSRINLQPGTVKIQAKNIEIDGTVTFNAIKSQADAAYDVKNSAATAETNAKTYADGKASTAETNAKTYADGKASTAETNAKTYADGKASTAESNAKTYADGKASTAETNAKTYADDLADDLEDQIPTNVSELNNDSGFQNSSQVGAAISAATSDMATNTGVSNTYAAKTAAVAEEQLIYKSAASGTSSMSGTTTWVSDATGAQNTWTTKRPQYNSSYPVLFVAKQKKTVSNDVTCTTPVKDDTTTVIDGGHVTTGTIDASVVTVNNIDASKITTGTLSADRIAAGSLTIGKVNGLQTTLDGKADDSDIPTKVSDLSNDSGFQNSSQVSSAVSNGIAGASVTDLSDGSSYSTTSQMNTAIGNATGTKADKTAALSRSQRIYYRSTSIQNSLSGPTTWLSTSGTGYENWSLSIPQLTNGEDSYPYLYTCVQNQTAAQYAAGSVCTCTPVVRDDSTTVIDGGSITTGVVSANYIDAAHLQIGKGQVDGLSEYMSYMTFEDGVLKITKPGFNYSVEIRNDGVYIVDPNNHAIASYKDYITLGTKDGNNIDIRSDSINFNIGNQTYAYAAQDKWFASNAEVSGAMYIDDYSLRQNANGDFVLGRKK